MEKIPQKQREAGIRYIRKYHVRMKKVHDLLNKYAIRGEHLLDIGCGDGITTIFLTKNLPMKIHGLEVHPEAAEIAGKNFDCKLCDCGKDRFPFENESFAIIHAGEVIEHILDTDNMVKECKRVLKPMGILIVSTPNLSCWINRVLLVLGYQPFDVEVSNKVCYGLPKSSAVKWEPVGHVRCFSLRALASELKSYGFKILEVHGASSSVPIVGVSWVDKICDKWFPSLARKIIVVAQKV